MSTGMGNGRSWESTLGLGISGRACARGAPAADLFPSEVAAGASTRPAGFMEASRRVAMGCSSCSMGIHFPAEPAAVCCAHL